MNRNTRTRLDFDQRLAALDAALLPLERVIHLLMAQLEPPVLIADAKLKGYRFANPTLAHFCILKEARAISSFRACLVLAITAHTQEIGVLIRVMTECTRQAEFALSSVLCTGEQSEQSKAIVSAFFNDLDRDGKPAKRSGLRQEDIHRILEQIRRS